jgi:hypothetical protein
MYAFMYVYVYAIYYCCKVSHIPSCFKYVSLSVLKTTTANNADEMVTCAGSIVSSVYDIFTDM